MGAMRTPHRLLTMGVLCRAVLAELCWPMLTMVALTPGHGWPRSLATAVGQYETTEYPLIKSLPSFRCVPLHPPYHDTHAHTQLTSLRCRSLTADRTMASFLTNVEVAPPNAIFKLTGECAVHVCVCVSVSL
jgi:hypothetical protein